MKCPSCGAEVGKGGICEYCGTLIPIQGEKQQTDKIEYPKNEADRNPSYNTNNNYNTNTVGEYKTNSQASIYQHHEKKNFRFGIMLLWALGWILFFPIPVMVLIWRKKNRWSLRTKIIVTIVFWILMWCFGSCGKKNNRNNIVPANIQEQQETTKEDLPEDNNKETEKESESEVVEAKTDKIEKNGFDSKTNNFYSLASFNISIPSYWDVTKHDKDSLVAYAETSGKTALIEIETVDYSDADESYNITYDGLKTDVENGGMDTLLRSRFTIPGDVVTSPFDNGSIKGFTGEFRFSYNSDIGGKGKALFFTSEKERKLLSVILVETDNTEYTYFNDFDKILKSVELKEIKEAAQETVTPTTTIEETQTVIETVPETQPETESIVTGNLTVKNCPELKEMLASKGEIDESYSTFATKYKGRIIEFDGRIDYCTHHGNYNTRFDYLVSAGDYNPDTQVGPTFKFEDVNYNNLHTDLSTVSVGLNVHIVAEVLSYNYNAGIFFLKPVSVTSR